MSSFRNRTLTALVTHTGSTDRPTPKDLPVRTFDGYGFLTIFKFVSDLLGMYALLVNNFRSGFVVAATGFILSLFLRIVANCFLGMQEIGPCNATMNVAFGTRFGFQNLSKPGLQRKKSTPMADVVHARSRQGSQPQSQATQTSQQSESVVLPRANDGNQHRIANFNEMMATTPAQTLTEQELIADQITSNNVQNAGGNAGHENDDDMIFNATDKFKIGPKTLTSVAEVIQQGFVFYPIMIMFLGFGFGAEFELFPLILISAFFSFSQIMCWMIAPSKNVAYAYIYFATWLSYTLPFLLLLLLAIVFDEVFPDSYYTRNEIYAWGKGTVVMLLGTIGLAVYNNEYSKTQNSEHGVGNINTAGGGRLSARAGNNRPSVITRNNPSLRSESEGFASTRFRSTYTMNEFGNYTIANPPAILYFEYFFSVVFFLFEIGSVLLFLSSKKAFFYDFDDDKDLLEESQIDAVLFTNAAFSGFLIIVSHIERITATTKPGS